MTGTEIIAEFRRLIGESIDSTTELALANRAKDLIEIERDWSMLIVEDATKTRLASDTYLTGKDLPTDFLRDYKVYLGDATLSDYYELGNIPFNQRRRFNSIANRYYIDWANLKIHITGTVEKTYTIYLYYIKQTPDLALATSPVWPTKFHWLIPSLMAELYQSGMDNDDITARQAVAHNKQATLLFNSMVEWDAKIKLREMNYNSAMEGNGFHEISGKVNIDE
jgi:hypothetical protein